MILRLRVRGRPLPPYEATTSLINVAFLLLAFFMMIGRMDATAPFVVEPPRSAVGTPLPQGGATVSLAADGALALDGAPATTAEIARRLGEAAAAGGLEVVRINADAGARLAELLPLAEALQRGGVPRVVLVVTPPAPGRR